MNSYNPLTIKYDQPPGFLFEEDFMEDNIRCIPMLVRFKLDAAGIKLKLAEWSKFSVDERNQLAIQQCDTDEEIVVYKNYLQQLVKFRSGNQPTVLQLIQDPAWANLEKVDESLLAKASEYDWTISVEQWKRLSDLQRFALLKLYRPGHENKNFPKAMKEFGLADEKCIKKAAMKSYCTSE
ncbi:MAG: nitrate reductase associated protein [Ferruginibacter sp.]